MIKNEHEALIELKEQTRRLIMTPVVDDDYSEVKFEWQNAYEVAKNWETKESLYLNSLALEINQINRANGWEVVAPEEWEDDYKIPAILALITSETSEALEGFRANDKENFADECADQIIRILDLTGGLGIDIDNRIKNKLEKNRNRGYKHGGKRV